jgi:hypothetical protein
VLRFGRLQQKGNRCSKLTAATMHCISLIISLWQHLWSKGASVKTWLLILETFFWHIPAVLFTSLISEVKLSMSQIKHQKI